MHLSSPLFSHTINLHACLFSFAFLFLNSDTFVLCWVSLVPVVISCTSSSSLFSSFLFFFLDQCTHCSSGTRRIMLCFSSFLSFFFTHSDTFAPSSMLLVSFLSCTSSSSLFSSLLFSFLTSCSVLFSFSFLFPHSLRYVRSVLDVARSRPHLLHLLRVQDELDHASILTFINQLSDLKSMQGASCYPHSSACPHSSVPSPIHPSPIILNSLHFSLCLVCSRSVFCVHFSFFLLFCFSLFIFSDETSIMADVAAETDLHPVATNIDRAYDWNEWSLRKKALQMVDLRNRKTHSTQTNLSHFRRDAETQVYLPPYDEDDVISLRLFRHALSFCSFVPVHSCFASALFFFSRAPDGSVPGVGTQTGIDERVGSETLHRHIVGLRGPPETQMREVVTHI